MDNKTEIIEELLSILQEAKAHLDFCDYGDNYEKECAGDLPERIDESILKVEKFLSETKT